MPRLLKHFRGGSDRGNVRVTLGGLRLKGK